MQTERSLIASGAHASPAFRQAYTARGFPSVMRQKGYLMMPGCCAPHPAPERGSAVRHGHFGRFGHSKCAIRRNCIALRSDHVLDNLPVIERLRATRLAALEQPVVSLRVEQAVLVKSGFLKAVIHIRCEGQSNPCPSQAKAVFHRRASAHSDNG